MAQKKTNALTIMLTPEMRDTVEAMAEAEDRSVSAVIRRLIQREIEQRKSSKTKTLRPVS